MKNLVIKAAAWKQSQTPREEGQGVIEYALIIAVVSVVLIATVLGFGTGAVARAKTAVDAVLA